MPDANGLHDSYSYEAVVVWKGKTKHSNVKILVWACVCFLICVLYVTSNLFHHLCLFTFIRFTLYIV